MKSVLLSDILQLSVAERILLVQDIWDSVAAEIEALRLDPRERARLAEPLFQSLSALAGDENERLWVDKALAGDDEMDAGATIARPADDVFRVSGCGCRGSPNLRVAMMLR